MIMFLFMTCYVVFFCFIFRPWVLLDRSIRELESAWRFEVDVKKLSTTISAVLPPGLLKKLSFLPEPVVWCLTPVDNTVHEETKTEIASETIEYLVGDGYRAGRGVDQDHKEACRRYCLG